MTAQPATATGGKDDEARTPGESLLSHYASLSPTREKVLDRLWTLIGV